MVWTVWASVHLSGRSSALTPMFAGVRYQPPILFTVWSGLDHLQLKKVSRRDLRNMEFGTSSASNGMLRMRSSRAPPSLSETGLHLPYAAKGPYGHSQSQSSTRGFGCCDGSGRRSFATAEQEHLQARAGDSRAQGQLIRRQERSQKLPPQHQAAGPQLVILGREQRLEPFQSIVNVPHLS